MNLKTNILEEYVNYVDNTREINKYIKLLIISFVIILCLFLLSNLFNYSSK